MPGWRRIALAGAMAAMLAPSASAVAATPTITEFESHADPSDGTLCKKCKKKALLLPV